MNDELLIRYLTHRCTASETANVNEWIAADASNANWLFEMERIWSLKEELRFSDKREIEAAYNRFVTELNERKQLPTPHRRPSLLQHWAKYAAAAVLAVLLGTNIYLLADKEPAVSMNVVEVPKGQRASLTLSDGTKVWLNSYSRLSYPAQFAGKQREVKLEGEGFFEVAHNKELPFIVQVNLLKVKVLGTKFNLKAYQGESSFITLTEGKVEVETNNREQKITMSPNQQVSYSKEQGLMLDRVANAHVVKSWTQGEAAYIDEPLAEILNDLERKFDVKIAINDQALADETFTCRVKEANTINQVLNLLKETRRLDYQITGNNVRIYKPTK